MSKISVLMSVYKKENPEYLRASLESLLATGGIKGYPEDNTFRPQGTITKLEFLSMVVNSLDPDGTKLAEGVQQAKDDVEMMSMK